jgi:hypothetical protein
MDLTHSHPDPLFYNLLARFKPEYRLILETEMSKEERPIGLEVMFYKLSKMVTWSELTYDIAMDIMKYCDVLWPYKVFYRMDQYDDINANRYKSELIDKEIKELVENNKRV